MSDYTVFVRGRATAYLGGPPLVKMAIDEVVDEETFGGAEMHARNSGLADYLAADELDGLRIAATSSPTCVGASSARDRPSPPTRRATTRQELIGACRPTCEHPFDIREMLARDARRLAHSRSSSRCTARTLVCGWGSIHGFPVGVLGNNGILFSQEAQKGAQFIQLCNPVTPAAYSCRTSPDSWSDPTPSRAASSATGRS